GTRPATRQPPPRGQTVSVAGPGARGGSASPGAVGPGQRAQLPGMTLLERLQHGGLRRRGGPVSGFHYQDADGRRVDAATVKRIEALRVPPAWTEVFIHPSSRAHLQAVGRDKAGRWQYRYHEGFRARQDALKFERLVAFGHALPSLRRTITRHLRLPGMQRERVMAGILRILSTSFLRPGSQVYAAENGSYGIATLRPQHVSVRGDVVRLSSRTRRATERGLQIPGCGGTAHRRPPTGHQRLHPRGDGAALLGQGLPHLGRNAAR